MGSQSVFVISIPQNLKVHYKYCFEGYFKRCQKQSCGFFCENN